MTIYCITGQATEALQQLEVGLRNCGMAQPRPLQRNAALDLPKWHQGARASMLMPSTAEGRSAPNHLAQPSRLWEQLAVDLLVSNMDAPIWGWADAQSVELLGFWSELAPEMRFILVCEDRPSLICRSIESGETAESVAQNLALWHRHHQSMLRFHLRHPAISLLVWAADVHNQPKRVMDCIEQAWNTGLTASLLPNQTRAAPNLLVQQMIMTLHGL